MKENINNEFNSNMKNGTDEYNDAIIDDNKKRKKKPILTEEQLRKRKSLKTKTSVAAFVLLLGVGIMGNWYYQNSDFSANIKPLINSTQTKNLGEAEFVDATTEIPDSKESTYFSEEKLKRQTNRDEAMDDLKESISSLEENDEVRLKAEEQLAQITTFITIENKIETLVMAKGVNNCLAIINNDGTKVDIIVDSENLDDKMIMQIKEIAIEQLECDFKNVTIIQSKNN